MLSSYRLYTGSFFFDVDAHLKGVETNIFGFLGRSYLGSCIGPNIDAQLLRYITGSLTADGQLFEYHDGNISIDAQLFVYVNGSFTADGQLYAVVGDGFVVDAQLYTTYNGLFTSDSYLKTAYQTGQGLFSDKIMALWRKKQTDFIQSQLTTGTVYYRAEETGQTSNDYDSFFNESTDPGSPSTYDQSVSTTPNPSTVDGRFRSDLYGISISRNEAMEIGYTGNFQPGDALFTVFLDAVKTDKNDISKGTIFDRCDYVGIAGMPYKYKVLAVTYRGLGGPFIVDVWLRRTNQD